MVIKAREMVSQRAMALAGRLGPAVRPLITDTNNQYALIGSSVVVGFGTELFLFTAAHVLDHGSLVVGLPRGFAKLQGEVIKSTPPKGRRREDDAADIGIVRLSDELRESLAGVPFISAPGLDVDDQAVDVPATKHYMVVGFPSSRARFIVGDRRARFEGFVLTSKPARSLDYQLLGLTDHAHIVLDFEQKTARAPDGQTIAPKVNGVSGGGIWNLGDSFNPEGFRARLAGIAIEWHRRKAKVIIGTRISLYCEVLRQHRPDLSEVIPKPTRIRLRYRPA
jgi:hypothetical protein